MTITTSQILAVCGAIITINAVVTIIVDAITKAKEPQKEVAERVTDLEERVDRHDELFKRDDMRLEQLERSTTVMLRALLALLDHGIDGEVEPMEQAKKELTDFLIKRN